MEIRNRGTRVDGSIIWQARYYDPNDSTRRIEKTFRKKQDAKNWLTAQKASALEGTHIDPRKGDLKLSQLADQYRETWTDLEPKTRTGYESILNRHVLPTFGSKRLIRISPQAVQRYVNELNAAEYAPNTIRRIYGVLNQLLALAQRRRYIAINPCDAVKLPKKAGRRRQIKILPLTDAQVVALANAIDAQYRLAVLLDAYMGLRAGELWALRRDDIDLLRGTLTVDEALSEVTAESAEQVPESERLTDSLIVKGTKTDQTRVLTFAGVLEGRACRAPSPAARRRRCPLVHLRHGGRLPGPAEQLLQAFVQARRLSLAPGGPVRAALPRPPPYVRGVGDRARRAPVPDQDASRPRGHSDDAEHLRAPVPEHGIGARRSDGRPLPAGNRGAGIERRGVPSIAT